MSSSAVSMFYTENLIWLLIILAIIIEVLQLFKGTVLYFTNELDSFCCM